MTLFEAAEQARTRLVAAGVSPATAVLDASLLARHAAGWDLATWLARRSEPAAVEFAARYESLITRRLAREPVAYIRGFQEFWGRDFAVSPAVLIPRPDTELLVEVALAFLADRRDAVVIDIGTGTGCIAITLALEQQRCEVHAVEVSEEALAVAHDNAARYDVSNRVHFHLGAYLADAPRPVDLIVTNPPYVSERDRPGLTPEVREYEPAVALYGGGDGWGIIRTILREAGPALTRDGCLMMEIGFGQSEGIAAEVDAVSTLELLEVRQDLQGIPRLAILRRRLRR